MTELQINKMYQKKVIAFQCGNENTRIKNFDSFSIKEKKKEYLQKHVSGFSI